MSIGCMFGHVKSYLFKSNIEITIHLQGTITQFNESKYYNKL